MAKKRSELPLHKKIEVIADLRRGRSQRELALAYSVSKSQIQRISTTSSCLLEEWESFTLNRDRKRRRKARDEEFDEKVMDWFRSATGKGIPVSGPMIQEKARTLARDIGIECSASNGWLESFRRRHNIVFKAQCGESGDVDGTVVEDWRDRLPELLGSYDAKDIFNMDETGLFFRALPNKTLMEKGIQCRGGKMAKERLTIALCCSATGEKFKPLAIWKSLNPRCFRGQNLKRIGVLWEANSKAWMTMKIFERWLEKFNAHVKGQNREVLLIVDNAPGHAVRRMSNVKLLFLPPNVTSELQPLDQGIIQAFKLQYRGLMLRWMLTNLDDCDRATELSKKISVLEALRWVSNAWANVRGDTIVRCFRRCGIASPRQIPAPESDGDEISMDDFQDLCRRTGITHPTFEEELVCCEVDDRDDQTEKLTEDEDDGDELVDEVPTEPPTSHEALRALQTLKMFAVSSDVLPEATLMVLSKCEKQLQESIIRKDNKLTQLTIESFFDRSREQ